MKSLQPFDIYRLSLKRHAVGDLLRDCFPTAAPLLVFRKRAPTINGFHETHQVHFTSNQRGCDLKNLGHAFFENAEAVVNAVFVRELL